VRGYGPQTLLDDELAIAAERGAPRAARRWVMRAIAGVGVGGAVNQVVELLTGELVSNAVVHGPAGGTVRVRVLVQGAVVWVGVSDEGGGRPVAGRPEPTAPSGRGLALVDALAGSWGTQRHAAGKTVWFEVDAEA